MRIFTKNGNSTIYYFGKELSSNIDLRMVRYVFTNKPGNSYYRVKRIYSAKHNNLFSSEEEQKDESMRVIFELGKFVKLGDMLITMNAKGGEGTMRVTNAGEFMPLKQLKEKYYHLCKMNDY